jgi:hypothetical protein
MTATSSLPFKSRFPKEKEAITMATMQEVPKAEQAVYQLEGTLLEACSCGILCPCWVGEDPDNGDCLSVNAYHFNGGSIRGLDVSGLNFISVNIIPGNVLTPKSWRVVLFVDGRASPEQRQAILDAYQGKLGGPLADLAGLVGEVLAIETGDITHEVVDGRGVLRIGGVLEAEMAPFTGSGGIVTTLRDSLFSTVPGSPAYVSKAAKYRVSLPQYGMAWEFEGRNAIQADYKIEYFG